MLEWFSKKFEQICSIIAVINFIAFGVAGAFFGAVVGSAILTPIIRDISAYFVQKHMEKKNPELKEQPYKPYFQLTKVDSSLYAKKQPLSMKSYMASTHNTGMKI